MVRSWLVFGLTLAVAGVATTARAQDDLGSPPVGGESSAADPADTTMGSEAGTGRLGDEQAIASEQMGAEEFRDTTDPFEDPTEGYFFAGLFYRHIFVPEFLLNLFTDQSTAASNPAFGAELTYRKDGFDIVGSLWWARYAVEGPFRGSGDHVHDTEFIESDLSVLFLSASFLWSTPFNDIFALEYGVGLGLGVVLGSLHRTEAYPSSDQGSVNGYSACDDVNTPNVEYCDGPEIEGYCDGDGGHYCEEGKWSDGGDVPNVVPWFAVPQIALRIKPIRQLMIRIEGGFGLGFFLGGAVNYGF